MDLNLKHEMFSEPAYFSQTYATLSLKETQITITKEE